ncbi:MAG: hypothetical protein AABN34_07230 [Acidobacteriota bacterium]
MASKLARLLFILILVIPSVRAQSAQSASGEAEKRKAREEREKKALALADEIIKVAQSLRLPENRIRIDIALAGSLWDRDEKRARSLFKSAAASLSEMTAAVDSGDREYPNLTDLPQQLRQEILQVVANHDPKLALDFLRASRPASSEQRSYAQPAFEAQLQMRLAEHLAAKEPQQAFSLAEDSLKIAIDNGAMNMLYRLHSQDKALAEKFLGCILTRLRSDDFSRSPESVNIAIVLLRTWIESNRPASDQSGQRSTVHLSLANLDEQTARELSNILIKTVFNNAPAGFTGVAVGSLVIHGGRSFRSYPGQVVGILQQLKPMLPDIERLSPNQIAALRERIAEMDRSNQIQQGSWAKYQELLQNGTASELIEASKTAPPEVANNLVQQAAWKALNQGDEKSAREIVGQIADPQQRREMALNLDRQSVYRASEQQKLAEGRALLSRLPSLEERAGILTQLGASAAAKGDKSTALELLAEAQAMIGDRALSYPQLQTQIQIAGAYEQLDASKSAAIVEQVIDHLNELASAALVLNGFDIQQYFRDGEFVINSGNPMNTVAQESAQMLASLSRNDYDRARLAADRLQRPEMRVMALLQIAQVALSPDDR